MADNIVGSNKPEDMTLWGELQLTVWVPKSLTDDELDALDDNDIIGAMFGKLETAASNLLAEINPEFKLGRVD